MRRVLFPANLGVLLLIQCGFAFPALAQVYRFDMGTSASPVAKGYTRVLKDTVYAPSLGYGWSRRAALDFDRTETLPYWVNWGHKNPESSEPRKTHWEPTNLLTRDGVQHPEDVTFRVDVPNGDYWVRITCGDPYRPCRNLFWEINGEAVMHGLSTRLNWGGFVTDRTTRDRVAVTDGPIAFRFYNTAETGVDGEFPTMNTSEVDLRTYDPVNSINAIEIHPAASTPALAVRNRELVLRESGDDSPELRAAFALYTSGKLDEAVDATEKVTGPRAALLQAHLLTWIAGDLNCRQDVPLVEQAQALAEQYHTAHPDDWDSGELAILCNEFALAAKRADVSKRLSQEDGPMVLGSKRLCYADDGFERIKPGEALYDKALWHNLRSHSGDQTPFPQNPSAHEFEWFLEQLLAKYPDNETLRIHSGEEIPWGDEYLPHNVPANAPKWAVLAREILGRCDAVISWWVTNRMSPDGQLGGGWGDDCELLRRWPVVVFCGDSRVVREGVFRLIDGLWDSGILENGYEPAMRDVEHSAEPSSDTQPWGILLDYGNPKYVERNMLTMQLFERVWTGIAPNGDRLFKSNIIGASGVKADRPYTVDVPYHGRAVRHGEMLVWYNRHPAFLKLYHEWLLSWVDATARAGEGKPAGIIPAAICFEDGSPVRINFPEMTQFVVYTDRMPLYPGPIFSMYTGGFEMYPYPTYHITWEGVKTKDFAAFVSSADSAHLSVRLYNFDTEPMPVRARLWRLAPGEYRVMQMDDEEPQHSIQFDLLERGQTFAFELPPQRPCHVSFKLLHAFPHNDTPKADLAIGPEDVRIHKGGKGSGISVTVHNIGIANSAETDVHAMGKNGAVLARATVPPIEWPEDLTARTATVDLSIPRRKLRDLVEVHVNSDKRVSENVYLNNRVMVQTQFN